MLVNMNNQISRFIQEQKIYIDAALCIKENKNLTLKG